MKTRKVEAISNIVESLIEREPDALIMIVGKQVPEGVHVEVLWWPGHIPHMVRGDLLNIAQVIHKGEHQLPETEKAN